MARTGKPPLYEQMKISEKLSSIEGWCRQGATMKELAQMLGVHEATIYRWKGKYSEFSEAIRAGARETNGEILHAAFDQAVGCFRRVREIVKLREEFIDPASGKKLVKERAEVKEYDKYFEPVPIMTKFMLMNRMSEEYREKQEIKTDSEVTYTFESKTEEAYSE